jgi:branched-chain amino acid transport system ATP-binding protein
MLKIENVSKRFGGVQAIGGVSAYLKEGEVVGLIGPNGAGKTTLFNLISGFIKPDQGTIAFENRNITGLKPYKICRLGMTRTFQIVEPFKHLTVFENILVGALNKFGKYDLAADRVKEVIDLVGLARVSARYGMDLNIVESKKLEIAKALSVQPRLLLLDEIMAGLNPTEVKQVTELIMNLNKDNITFLVIEHNMRAIMEISARIIVLNYGEKIFEGSPSDIIHNKAVVDAYLGDETDA